VVHGGDDVEFLRPGQHLLQGDVEKAANEEQDAALKAGRVLIKDAIADITLQQVLVKMSADNRAESQARKKVAR
jgi:isocitrate dehydrogenase